MSATSARFSVGDLQCQVVSDGVSAFPAGLVFANAPEDERDRALRERGLPTDMVASSLNVLVVDTGEQLVLIDTGIGPFTPETGRLIPNLRAAGIDPAAIDAVLLTHGHPDHIGGTVDAEGRPAFPNARYLMRREEWEFWTAPDNLERLAAGELQGLGEIDQFMGHWARSCLLPIEEQCAPFTFDGQAGEMELLPGIRVFEIPGHTPYHLGVIVASRGERLVLPVDAAINPIHLAEPDWHPAFDWDPPRALATRRRLFDRLASDGTPALLYHFPFPGLGRVSRAGKGWQWQPVDA